MTELLLLLYIPDFFGVEGTFVRCFDLDGNLKGSDFPGPSTKAVVVSYEAATLVDEYKRAGVELPETIIDIGEAFRLISGRAKDEGAEKNWSFFRKIKQQWKQSHLAADFVAITQGRKERPSAGQLDEMMVYAAQSFKALWLLANEQLSSGGEHDRFWNVEVPFAQICWRRQWTGIPLNLEALANSLALVRREKYIAYRRLAEITKVSPSDLSFRNVRSILPNTDLSFLLDTDMTTNLEADFRLAAESSELAATFLTYIRANRDEHVLSRMAGDLDKIYPTFQPIGTVTGRTLISDPNLQNLRRAYRKIVAAEPGMRLVYLDFKQFEPGIAAYLSKDPLLVQDYNNSDIYAKLSEHVFGTEEKRGLTKRAFISYLYGMSEQRIGRLLSGDDEQNNLSERLSSFFARYVGLRAFRTACQNDLFHNGRIGTLEGNYRHRSGVGALTPKERRWAANQPVQGTASLILKEAMLSISRHQGAEVLIMPLHDAVLLQFGSQKLEKMISEAVLLMRNAFNLRCPGIRCEVSISSFDGQELAATAS